MLTYLLPSTITLAVTLGTDAQYPCPSLQIWAGVEVALQTIMMSVMIYLLFRYSERHDEPYEISVFHVLIIVGLPLLRCSTLYHGSSTLYGSFG